jgi:hypothetical protein
MSYPGTSSEESFFDSVLSDKAAQDTGPSDRVRELKRILFDLAYLIMNADGVEHDAEKEILDVLAERMASEGSVDVQDRAAELDAVIEQGPSATRKRIKTLADAFLEHVGSEKANLLGSAFLDLLRELIVADDSVTPEEFEFFNVLTTHWGIDKSLR